MSGFFHQDPRFMNVKGDNARRSKAIRAATAVMAVVALSACGRLGNLQAKKAFKDANASYQAQNYVEAAEHYQAVVSDPSVDTDPNLVKAYFFLGNSYDNLYKPARKGEAENDALLTKAIENYKLAAEKDPTRKSRSWRSTIWFGLRARQTEHPTEARSNRSEDDSARSERSDELLRPRADLRRRRRTRPGTRRC